MNEREEKIRHRAYEIWEQEGRPHGQDMKHWLQAFKEFGEQVDAAAARVSTKSTAKAKIRQAARTGEIRGRKAARKEDKGGCHRNNRGSGGQASSRSVSEVRDDTLDHTPQRWSL